MSLTSKVSFTRAPSSNIPRTCRPSRPDAGRKAGHPRVLGVRRFGHRLLSVAAGSGRAEGSRRHRLHSGSSLRTGRWPPQSAGRQTEAPLLGVAAGGVRAQACELFNPQDRAWSRPKATWGAGCSRTSTPGATTEAGRSRPAICTRAGCGPSRRGQARSRRQRCRLESGSAVTLVTYAAFRRVSRSRQRSSTFARMRASRSSAEAFATPARCSIRISRSWRGSAAACARSCCGPSEASQRAQVVRNFAELSDQCGVAEVAAGWAPVRKNATAPACPAFRGSASARMTAALALRRLPGGHADVFSHPSHPCVRSPRTLL
jgi:hypothetical protein